MSDDSARGGGAHGSMDMEPGPMMAGEHYKPYRWVQGPVALLAVWLMTSPFVLGYEEPALVWSDVASGAVVLVLAALALSPKRGAWFSWANALVGIWLMLAPIVFWAKSPAAFANDTLIGALLVTFAFLVPMGMAMKGAEIPPGWSYNPSSWPQRAPLIALAFVGFFMSRYMAAFQLGYIDSVWEPFFGDGTRRVLTSEVSRSFPVSDAGLGSVVYLVEALSGFMGDKRRWRTMPWMVAIFGFAVVPLGIVSIVLIIMQPLVVGAWCTLCLASAVAMLVMVPLALDEIVAMIQFVLRRRREAGVSTWHAFWYGGNLPEDSEVSEPAREETWRPAGMVWGVTQSWALFLSIGVGIWLMFAPTLFGTTGAAADSDHLVGALVVVFATIALAEVARPVRFLNVLAGLWLAAAPWLFSVTGGARASDVLAGLALILLSLPLGKLRDHYGNFDRYVAWWPGAKRFGYLRHAHGTHGRS